MTFRVNSGLPSATLDFPSPTRWSCKCGHGSAEKINKKISRYEITAVYTHKQAKADIVLVHGLNGNPEKTWTAPNDVYWPTDLLPKSLKNEHANVLVYGYNADVYSTRKDRSPSDNFVHQHAQSLVTSLTQYRKSEGTERNPIIWVAHSLGGIVTKRALLYSNDVRAHHQEDFRSIFVSTYGIVFLGTPHIGSDIATWGRILQYMSDVVIPRKFFETESVLLKTLKKDNETLQSINSHFLDIYQRFRIHMVHENHTTDLKGTKVLVVDASSASPQLPGVTYYGIEATHSGMCKFESENAPGYRNVSTALREWVAGSPEVIEVRWEVEEDDRRLRANLDIFERTRPYERTLAQNTHHQQIAEGNNETSLHHSPIEITSPQSALVLPEASPVEEGQMLLEYQTQNEPLFIHPEPFRPNSYFIGREDELRGLHEMLKDRKRRSEGTSAVLIQCLPGGGKTHLARQYVFQHKEDYPGGIYWVRAKSRHEMEYWFWRIAKNEALKGLVDRKDVEELRDPKRIVQIVRKWFNTQSDWLMVLDGIQFDTPGLQEFIPDAKHTSLIYTSTERAVTGDPRFDNPQVMELGLLTAQQAQDLLLLEMDKREPVSADDQAKALELVQLMGRLPLMIHVAAQHLKATREPLARYLKSYKTRPKAAGLPAYKAVRDQLERRGANAALNLISILVFFDQHIPVEMLTLGLSALDKITPVRTCNASHRRTNLSNTLRILIAFALVERTESDDISPTSSQSSKRSLDKNVDYLDLLRIHSVVQAFFIDDMNQRKEVHFWLERATAVWCRSYDEAHKRIQEDPGVGRPDDYRRFLIHGQRLLQNLQRFEKKSPELLSAAQSQVECRLEKIQGQVDELSQAIQRNIIEGLGLAQQPASVFERSSTMSETDSAATVSNHESQNSWEPFTGGFVDDNEPLQSPSAYDAVLATPPRWPVPYPTKGLMPPTPVIDDDQGTVVPPAALTPTMTAPDPAMIADGSGSPISPMDPSGSFLLDDYEDWQEVIPNHRVVRRNELRRYHDRAGAWRDRTVGDPRVGVSLEVAVGSLQTGTAGSRSPSRHRVTAQSDAEMELNKLKKMGVPLPPSATEANGSSSTEAATQPQPILGKNKNQSSAAELGTSPSGSLSSLGRIMSSPSSWKAGLMKRLRKNQAPSSPKLPAEQPATPTSALRQSQMSPPEDVDIVPPGPIFAGNRTGNSSPASGSSPFSPPTFSATEGIAIDEYLSQTPGLPVVVRRWDTEEPSAPDRSGGSPDQRWEDNTEDPMSFSYPLPRDRDAHKRTKRAPQQAVAAVAQVWMPAPSGYTSQPMSRHPSHQSMSSGQGGQLPISSPSNNQSPISPTGSTGSGPTRRMDAATGGGGMQSQSSPLAIIGSSPDPLSTRGARLLPISEYHRPASYTETEPSPRLDAAFPDVDTSYHCWEQLHNTNRGGVDDRLERSFPPGDGTNSPGSSSPPVVATARGWQRINRATARGGTRGRVRSQSLSPSPSPSTSRLQYQQQHPQHPLAASASFTPPEQASPSVGDTSSKLGGHDSGFVGGGEPMARSGSGGSGSGGGGSAGIRLGDGRVVEFAHVQQQSQSASTRSKPSPTMAATARMGSRPSPAVSVPTATTGSPGNRGRGRGSPASTSPTSPTSGYLGLGISEGK
ncbi:hypothetical protein B0H66DRAFT_638213 [Apodospora peruviana]|uniref:DUF676 domain-containing protein n=1 Tax=Apodospora peruviana TaxID=516989 RepID=A0AAE0IAW5_9PEZI|nr:hypothetical protein B0H66DRAFT_638213 [Apodospora peruviana]